MRNPVAGIGGTAYQRGMKPILPLLLPLALLAGCEAKDRGFPSLAIRPVERPIDAPAATAESAPSAASARRIEGFAAQIDDADRRFKAEVPRVAALVREAGPAGGERWVVAQSALSRLGEIGAEVGTALNALDQAARELTVSAAPSAQADLAAASALTSRGVAIQGEQAAVLEELNRTLPQ